ncbi:MAG: hypothetical protein AMXMBFR13_32080 [Phycisphaerae bacterium]
MSAVRVPRRSDTINIMPREDWHGEGDDAGEPLAYIPPLVSGKAFLPLHHHPVIGLSLVLIAACAAQIVVWVVSQRLLTLSGVEGSAAVLHGGLFELLRLSVGRVWPAQTEAVLFVVCLSAALLSAVGWYGAARVVLGPPWGFWTALVWVLHPAFAFLAQRPAPLSLAFLLTPFSLWALVSWRRSSRATTTWLAGVGLAAIGLVGFQGWLLLPLVLPAISVAPYSPRKRLAGVGMLLAGFVLVVGAGWWALAGTPFIEGLPGRAAHNLRVHLDDGDMAEAARQQLAADSERGHLAPITFLLSELRSAPADTLRWLGRRLTRTVYATSGGQLQRPLFALQVALILPALWGWIVACRHQQWRWSAVVGAMYVAVFWLIAAIGEPLARNVVPAGGILIMFALVGFADVYERLFGRSLTRPGAPRRSWRRHESEDDLFPDDLPIV